MTDSFQQLGGRLDKLGEDTLEEIQGHTKRINAIAQEVASINKQIISLEATGHEANDLRDQRGQALSEIAELIDIKVLDRATGSVDVIAGDFLLVSGARASKLDAALGSRRKARGANCRVDDKGPGSATDASPAFSTPRTHRSPA